MEDTEKVKKQSGLNTAKPYHDLIKKIFSIFNKIHEDSFTKTIEILTEYLSVLEKSELGASNNDDYIKFNLELRKSDQLPLFHNYKVLDISSRQKDYQFLRLMLKKLGYLLLDLNDKVLLKPNLKGIKTFLHLERVYIEKILETTNLAVSKNELEQDELINYFSSFNTLMSYFSAIIRQTKLDLDVIKILGEIETQNREIHILVQEKFNLTTNPGQYYTYSNYNTVIPKTVQYI